MARKVRTISVNLTAGTAKFFVDLDQAAGKFEQFGQRSSRSMRGAIPDYIAAGAAIRSLEGSMNVRAVERFLTSVLPLGPALAAAFPVVGAVAFVGILTKMGEELYKFYRSIADAPEKIAGGFRQLDRELLSTNDELRVSNDRLENSISKLEGHRENTLKLALDEARVAADKLAGALDKDLQALYKLFKENEPSFGRQMFGEISTSYITKEFGGMTGFGAFTAQIDKINDEGYQQLAKARTEKERDAAQTQTNTRLLDAYQSMLYKVNRQLSEAKGRAVPSIENLQMYPYPHLGEKNQAEVELLTRAQAVLQQMIDGIPLRAENTDLTAKKESLEAKNANAALTRPFENKIEELNAQFQAATEKLNAAGLSEGAKVLAKAYGDAFKTITEVNKALKEHHQVLSAAQEQQIRGTTIQIAQAEAEAQWQTKLASAKAAIDERVRSLKLLTDAIGKSFEETRKASIESSVMQEVGAAQYFDPAWMQAHEHAVTRGGILPTGQGPTATVQPGIEDLRAKAAEQFDAEHAKSVAQAIDNLNDQIKLERELARVASQGAEAVRQATLAAKLQKMEDAGATKEQIKAQVDLYNVQRAAASATETAKLNEKTEATERLTRATLQSAEAMHRANLENKIQELQREGLSRTGPEAQAVIREEEATRNQQLAELAVHQDRLRAIDDEIAKLNDAKQVLGDTLPIEIALRDLENQRLRALAEQSVQMRSLRDGARAFFIEMQKDAESAAQIVYNALNSAVDQVSANLAKLFTGQKTNWAKSFQQLGESMAQSSIKSILQMELGKLGAHFGVQGKPDGTAMNPFWVRMASASGGTSTGLPFSLPGGIPVPGLNQNGGSFESGTALAGMLGPAWAGLFGLGASSGGEAIGTLSGITELASFAGFAGGGDIDPGETAWVGEKGPELASFPRGASITPMDKVKLGGTGDTVNVHVDARGADLGVANRLMSGLQRAAVSTAVRAMHERSQRVPKGSR